MKADFDIAAKRYDETFTYSSIGSMQRHRVWRYLEREFEPTKSLRILELNCGTGEDALFLARSGHEVLCTDISEDMITICKKKAEENQLGSSVTFRQMDIKKLHLQSFDHSFDLIFSNFGGLNCLAANELKEFIVVAARLLSEHGRIIMVMMPRYCIIESLYFFTKFKFSSIFRRNTSDALNVNVDGVDVKTYYHSPGGISAIFDEKWSVNHAKSIGFIPSYLEQLVKSNKIVGTAIKSLDRIFIKLNWIAMSDHFLFDVSLKKPVRV